MEVRDNHLDFYGYEGASLDGVSFYPTWWSITPGQPIEERCVIDDEEDKPNRVKVLCGRQTLQKWWQKTSSLARNAAAIWVRCVLVVATRN